MTQPLTFGADVRKKSEPQTRERERAAAEKGASFLGRRERFMRKMNGEKEESKSERRMRALQDSLAASSLSSTLRCRAFCCCQTGINNKSAWLCKCERPSARSSHSAICLRSGQGLKTKMCCAALVSFTRSLECIVPAVMTTQICGSTFDSISPSEQTHAEVSQCERERDVRLSVCLFVYR